MYKKITISIFFLLLFYISVVLATEPISVEQFDEYIVKTFELPPDTAVEPFIENEFTEGKLKFVYQSTEKEEITSVKTKDHSFTVEQKTNTDDKKTILAKFEPHIDCEEDGMTGRAYIAEDSLETKVSGYTKKSYTVSDTKEYNGLPTNDPSGIPKTVTKDGHALAVQSINWVVLTTEIIDDAEVPTSYRATVKYSTTATKSVPSEYTSTVTYNAILEKTVVDKVIYTVTYKGEELPSDSRRIFYIILAIAVLISLGCVFFIIKVLKKDVDIYNLQNDEYVLISREWIDMRNPTLDLLPFKADSKTDSYALVLSKKALKELRGKNLTITMENTVISKTVVSDRIYI